jgi:hypothetical protein
MALNAFRGAFWCVYRLFYLLYKRKNRVSNVDGMGFQCLMGSSWVQFPWTSPFGS